MPDPFTATLAVEPTRNTLYGAMPVYASGTTGPVITANDRLHDQQARNYKEYLTVMELLRAQLMNAVERTYYQVLEDPLFAMSDVTPLDILNHLTNEYGTLSPADILKNQAKLAEAWNAESPIEDLWKKIDNVKAVAKAANEEISDYLFDPQQSEKLFVTNRLNAIYHGIGQVPMTDCRR
jgi:hypothetical protein